MCLCVIYKYCCSWLKVFECEFIGSWTCQEYRSVTSCNIDLLYVYLVWWMWDAYEVCVHSLISLVICDKINAAACGGYAHSDCTDVTHTLCKVKKKLLLDGIICCMKCVCSSKCWAESQLVFLGSLLKTFPLWKIFAKYCNFFFVWWPVVSHAALCSRPGTEILCRKVTYIHVWELVWCGSTAQIKNY